ncbi:hypothetical protein [Nostoc sphaeroides]|uniref:hypothetical protein n=1 Tax=Nostoc sphaeroides TaxID=446679 RepID=UPI001C7077DE|nr:hypothetical protein [Nostoc sphaeroides]
MIMRRDALQYGLVKARDAINRRLYNNQSFVETAIYRVFVIVQCIPIHVLIGRNDHATR